MLINVSVLCDSHVIQVTYYRVQSPRAPRCLDAEVVHDEFRLLNQETEKICMNPSQNLESEEDYRLE